MRMSEQDQERLDELDRLLNDPETRMDPHKVWSLLAEISTAEAAAQAGAIGAGR